MLHGWDLERLRKEQAVSLTQLPMHFRFPGTIGPGLSSTEESGFETAEPKSSDFWPHVVLLALIRRSVDSLANH
jgi:hypothetical protein